MHFPDGYLSSRAAILSATEANASNVDSIECPVRGPNATSLFIDAVHHEGSNPGNSMLILTSGLHGVEGPVGAAVQLAAIDQWNKLERRPCLLVLHALNPHGFAWSRRQDASGIDLNRNFLGDQESYQGVDPVYTDLDPLLNPKRPPGFDGFLLRSALTTARIGLPKLKQVLAEGQFEFPKGLFFGGKEPSWTMQIFQQRLREWVGETK